MYKFSYKLALSIIIAGLFIVVSFAALNYENLSSPFYIIAGTLLVFILLFGFAMGSTYSTPVKKLLENANGVTRGELKGKIDLKTGDEIEELSRSFNKITEDLEKTKSNAENLKKIGEIKLETKALISEKVMDALEEKIRNRTADLERALVEVDKLKMQLAEKDKKIVGEQKKKKIKKS